MKREIPIVFLLVLAFALVQACDSKKVTSPTNKSQNVTTTPTVADNTPAPGNDQTPAPDTDAPGDPETIAVVPTTAGMRNFEQINATMSRVTEIEGNSAVINRYNTLRTQLPSDNDIKSFLFSAQIAVTVLAAEYCTALIANANNMYTNQRTAAVGPVNFGAAPSVALVAANRLDIAQRLIAKFWGNHAGLPAAAATQQSIADLINSLVMGEPNSTTVTRNAVIGACTAVLASSPVTTF